MTSVQSQQPHAHLGLRRRDPSHTVCCEPKLVVLFVGFIFMILCGVLQIWGLRSEICRLVLLDYVDYLTDLLLPSS
jgi:hypothetical protein